MGEDAQCPRPYTLVRPALFALLVRPMISIVLGLNARRRQLLPRSGPAIVVANHNSHLDTLALMTLFDWATIGHVRPVAAADYFLRNRIVAWFALKVVGILPLKRSGFGRQADPLAACHEALEAGQILIVFPEGSRGEPEQLSAFKSGVAHLSERFPEVPIVPVYLHGLGKALPRGEALLVPFFCDVFVGEPFAWPGARAPFMQTLETRMKGLASEGNFAPWT